MLDEERQISHHLHVEYEKQGAVQIQLVLLKYLFVLLLMWNLKYFKPLNSPFYNNFAK